MLLMLTCTAPNAPEIGFLLGKNPASVFEREFSAGKVWVFYPEVAEDHVTVALMLEVDPVSLVRGPAVLSRLDQYVNDRPYVASSLTSVAINTAFGSALAGRAQTAAARVDERMRWRVSLPAVACDGGPELIGRVFGPLGYAVSAERLPLDPQFPLWGEADLYSLTLEGEQTVRAVLRHLYVLLPVLDNTKHYWVGEDETEKLLAHGGDWLAAHPARELIARRYLRYRRPLITSALSQLAEHEPELLAEVEADAAQGESSEDAPTDASAEAAEKHKHELGLHEQRLAAVMEAVHAGGARSLADLGCGEGRLLALALKEHGLARIFGMDVSTVALSRARRRLHYEMLPPTQKARIEIAQGSLLYRDTRLSGFDAAALVEVIEHLDTARLDAMERVVFEHARPRRVIVTTPNREYNVHWEALGAERMRHGDHRFEWTRLECRAWGERVAATYGYAMAWQDIGPVHEALGAPSQMVVFDRVDGDAEIDNGGRGEDAAASYGERGKEDA